MEPLTPLGFVSKMLPYLWPLSSPNNQLVHMMFLIVV